MLHLLLIEMDKIYIPFQQVCFTPDVIQRARALTPCTCRNTLAFTSNSHLVVCRTMLLTLDLSTFQLKL